MQEFDKVYQRLNAAQRQAVDAIDGPVLVIAGPGTGKTQLLSARVAHILRSTDTLPQNILCLTFTESGAANMRDRLTRFIGKAAYDVQIGTYHAFGGDLIRRYPDYFREARLERPVDKLGMHTILQGTVEALDYRNPLKQTRHHLGDLITTISEIKRGLLSADDLRNIAKSNLQFIKQASGPVGDIFAPHVKRLPTKLAIAEPLFTAVADTIRSFASDTFVRPPFQSLATLALEQLEKALADASEVGKTTPLTKWKDAWLIKNAKNQYVFDGALEAARLHELGGVLTSYTGALEAQGLYDFDDMILRAIQALEQNDDLRYTLQERYQYILLDEFQDTNAAQLRLVELLTDNPANEGRPNVLAVGDDDQAIYAFQGAQYSNMRDFFRLYQGVLVVPLTENYRSTAPILATAKAVSAQLTDTLSAAFPALTKNLTAQNHDLPATSLEHTSYTSEIAERAGVAERIKALIADGVSPSDIAVLAPKHRYLEPLVPYLADVPLRYERRENILEAPIVRQLLTMSRLVVALHERQHAYADSLWPEVLSYPWWGFATSSIWQLSWKATDARKSWAELLLASDTFRPAALLFLSLAGQVETETLEVILDRLIGTDEVLTGETDTPHVRSPLRDSLVQSGDEASLYSTTTELTVLRTHLQEHQTGQGNTLMLRDLLQFVTDYETAKEKLLNTSPYSESANAVQLMTVFKAKGLEFGHVFLLHCQDDVWGGSAKGNSNKLTLPDNLAPIRHVGATEDERLRIFFVALTRAKYGLHLSSHTSTYAGKRPPRLKYLDEVERADGTVQSNSIPAPYNVVQTEDASVPPLAALESNWYTHHTTITPTLRDLLQDRLQSYRLSPTHLTKFLDLEHAGPRSFLLENLLRFPTAPSVDLAFGNAMHETLEWLQIETNQHGQTPTLEQAAAYATQRLELQPLTATQLAAQTIRSQHVLAAYLSDPACAFRPGDRPEYNFRNEGVFAGDALLSGKIDLLQVDNEHKTITVIDYKTGNLGNDPAKRHRYELQLYCYKILLQGSRTFRGYTVNEGYLVFVEPNSEGEIKRHHVAFKDAEVERVRQLLQAMWRRVQSLDMPDVSSYPATLAGIKQFESDLLA